MTLIQSRRGTNAEWSVANPILRDGEKGWERDTNRFKMGDGVTAWADLDYYISYTGVLEVLQAAQGQPGPGGGGITQITAENAAPESYIGVTWTAAGGWPARPTARTDIHIIVRAPISAGTPPIAVPPAVNGYYEAYDERSILPEATP